MLKPIFIEARDLPDAWFSCLWTILDEGHEYTIDRGSYEGQKRLEFDYVTVHIKYPGTRPLLPDIPPNYGIPNPVADDYLDGYLPYLMTDHIEPGEQYTYGNRLNGYLERIDKVSDVSTDGQVGYWIRSLKKNPNTNQAILQVGQPNDCFLTDPPCLRHLDCRIKDNKLHFVIYFRSWDLWNGFSANLAAIQMLKEYMASEIGVEDGEIIASSKGLHLYDYAWDLAKIRTNRE
jgi:thymidylate synthase